MSRTKTVSVLQTVAGVVLFAEDGAELPVVAELEDCGGFLRSSSSRASRSALRASISFLMLALLFGLRSLEYLPSRVLILLFRSRNLSYSGPSPSTVGMGEKKSLNFCHRDFSSAWESVAMPRIRKRLAKMDHVNRGKCMLQ